MMYEAIGTQTEGVKTFLLKHANHPGHVKTEKITVFFHLSINTELVLPVEITFYKDKTQKNVI